MRRSNEKMFDEIIPLRRRTKSSLTTATLSLVGGYRCALDIATIGYGNSDVFISDQVLNRKLNAFVDNFRSTRITKLFLNFFKFGRDDTTKRGFVGENLLQFCNQLDDLFVLVRNLLALEC